MAIVTWNQIPTRRVATKKEAMAVCTQIQWRRDVLAGEDLAPLTKPVVVLGMVQVVTVSGVLFNHQATWTIAATR